MSQSHPEPLFSVVIPARDEEHTLPACLASLNKAWAAFQRECHEPKLLEVVVVINRCTDSTEEIARSEGCKIAYSEAKNLAAIRNAGCQVALGKFLVTVDADSTVSENMFREINNRLSNPKIVGGGVLIIPERLSLGIILTWLLLVPIALWYRISAGLFFLRRSTFEEIGGFNEELPSVEDIAFARALRAYGRQRGQSFVNLFRAHIVTSCRKFDRFGDWYFLRHPLMTLRLLRGTDVEAANRVWYDFPH